MSQRELIPAAEHGEENHRQWALAVKFTMEAIERGVEMAQEEDCSWRRRFSDGLRDGRLCAKHEGIFGEEAAAIQREVKKVKEIKDKDEKRHGLAMAEKLQPGKISGELSAAGFRFGLVVSRFNSFITERLLAAAVDVLDRAGAASKDVM